MNQEILDFIKRRFPNNCNWLTGNCYYFSLILKDRFPQTTVCYDIINGHFVTLIDGNYYDWSGRISPNGPLVKWDEFEEHDYIQKQVIIRDCIM